VENNKLKLRIQLKKESLFVALKILKWLSTKKIKFTRFHNFNPDDNTSVGLDFYTYIYFQFQHKGQWNEMVL
jgi:hypothetical protein